MLFGLAVTLVFSGGAAVGIYSDSLREWIRPQTYGWERSGVDVPMPPSIDGPMIYIERMTKESNVGLHPRERYLRNLLPESSTQRHHSLQMAGTFSYMPAWSHNFVLSHPDAVLRVEQPLPDYWTIYEDDFMIFEISRQSRYEPIDEERQRRVSTWKVSHSTRGWSQPIPGRK